MYKARPNEIRVRVIRFFPTMLFMGVYRFPCSIMHAFFCVPLQQEVGENKDAEMRYSTLGRMISSKCVLIFLVPVL